MRNGFHGRQPPNHPLRLKTPLFAEQSVALLVGQVSFLLPFVPLECSLSAAIHVGIELGRPLVVFFSEVAGLSRVPGSRLGFVLELLGLDAGLTCLGVGAGGVRLFLGCVQPAAIACRAKLVRLSAVDFDLATVSEPHDKSDHDPHDEYRDDNTEQLSRTRRNPLSRAPRVPVQRLHLELPGAPPERTPTA